MLSKIMAVLLVIFLTGCAGSTMFGDEAPNIGIDEFPNSSEKTQAAEALQSHNRQHQETAQAEMTQTKYEETADALDRKLQTPEVPSGPSKPEAQETIQAKLTAYVETDPNGCPYGCTSHKQGCDIKGNISFNTQEKIYHVPGGDFYDATVVNPAEGEKWFCNEDEARNNGWRKSDK
jgi:hypothetical protein